MLSVVSPGEMMMIGGPLVFQTQVSKCESSPILHHPSIETTGERVWIDVRSSSVIVCVCVCFCVCARMCVCVCVCRVGRIQWWQGQGKATGWQCRPRVRRVIKKHALLVDSHIKNQNLEFEIERKASVALNQGTYVYTLQHNYSRATSCRHACMFSFN